MRTIPKFETKEELFDYLMTNKEDILYEKKLLTKTEASIGGYDMTIEKSSEADKAAGVSEDATEMKVKAVINTTGFLDSHGDVHIKGIWNRSVKNNRRIKMLQEHQMRFDKVIADKDDLAVSIKTFTWKELGYDAEGETQALLFDATVKQSRNEFMFNEYKAGNVDNHSVGMRYVHIKLAINSDKEGHKTAKEVWDKYYPEIVNGEAAEKQGYFWAVLEAKAIEGSAVVMGSNTVTPTLARAKAHSEGEQTQPDVKSLEENEIIKFLKS